MIFKTTSRNFISNDHSISIRKGSHVPFFRAERYKSLTIVNSPLGYFIFQDTNVNHTMILIGTSATFPPTKHLDIIDKCTISRARVNGKIINYHTATAQTIYPQISDTLHHIYTSATITTTDIVFARQTLDIDYNTTIPTITNTKINQTLTIPYHFAKNTFIINKLRYKSKSFQAAIAAYMLDMRTLYLDDAILPDAYNAHCGNEFIYSEKP